MVRRVEQILNRLWNRLSPLRTRSVQAGGLHQPPALRKTAAVLGIALGISFTVCFCTGLLSHLIQHPPGWFLWPSRPAGFYRITQGLHVATGIAAIPLLLAKLWTVFPRLFLWPPVENVAHALERLSLLPLVGGQRLFADERAEQHRPLVPVGVLLPGRPLLGVVDNDRGAGGPHRGESIYHLRRCSAGKLDDPPPRRAG